MTYTIWSNGGRYEWLIYENENVVARSNLVFNSRSAALTALRRYVKGM